MIVIGLSDGKSVKAISRNLFVTGIIVAIIISGETTLLITSYAGLLRGPKGDKGDKGDAGPAGNAGETSPEEPLLPLPCAGTYYDSRSLYTSTTLISFSLDQTKPGNQQSIFAKQGTTINVTGTFEVYCYEPTDIAQVFFIYSWTPSWPPASGYYHTLYNGVPGAYPGVTQSFNFSITIPASAKVYDVYYLYFCTSFKNTVEEAVNAYTKPVIMPVAVITAGP